MIARVTLILVIVASLAPAHSASSQETPESALRRISPGLCVPASGGPTPSSSPMANASPAPDFPAGINLTLLAEHTTSTVPQFFSSLVLTVRIVTLDPGTMSEPRKANGPVLFYVEAGSIGISVNSILQHYHEGDSVLVERSQNYSLVNVSPGLSTLLRLGVEPPGEEATIGNDLSRVIPPTQEPGIAPLFVRSELLLRGDIPPLEASANLHIACITLEEAGVDTGEVAHSGPVGMILLHGQLLIGDTGRLEPGGCILAQPREPQRLRAGTPLTSLLIVGAIPLNADWWQPYASDPGQEPSRGRFTVECEETETDSSSGRWHDTSPPELMAK